MRRPVLITGLVGAALFLWLVGWLWVGRYAMLDDALIHQRYAQGLARAGYLTFDGKTPSYGASSPLYVALLATIAAAVESPLAPKVISVASYLLLLGLAVAGVLRDGASRAGWIALLVLLLAPMAQRWLTDGMETSLVAASMLTLSAAVLGGREERGGPATAGLLFAFGAAVVLLRAELSLAIFFAVLGAVCVFPLRPALRRLAPLALGGLTGVAALVLTFGHVLPDTAVAKRTAPIGLAEAAFQAGRSTLASLSFGSGLAALWAVTLAMGLRRATRRGRAALIAANALLPCVILLVAARGQILHGVRHLLWIYFFLISWNVCVLDRMAAVPSLGRRGAAPWLGLAAGLALFAAWVFEAPAVAKILQSRSEIFLAMRRQPLASLADTTGAAYDVGFIGFFTGAPLLDLNGLVNGRGFAALPPRERIRRIGAQRPGFLFVTAPQAASLAGSLDLPSYRICHGYRSVNLGGSEVHLLAVRADEAARLGWACGKTLSAGEEAR